MKKYLVILILFAVPISLVIYPAYKWATCNIHILQPDFRRSFNKFRIEREIPPIENYFAPIYGEEINSNDWRDTTDSHIHYRKLVNSGCRMLRSEVDYYRIDSIFLIEISIYPESFSSEVEVSKEYKRKLDNGEEVISREEFLQYFVSSSK